MRAINLWRCLACRREFPAGSSALFAHQRETGHSGLAFGARRAPPRRPGGGLVSPSE